MNIPESTTPSERARSAGKRAASYRRRVAQNDAAERQRARRADPSTGKTRTINARHS